MKSDAATRMFCTCFCMLNKGKQVQILKEKTEKTECCIASLEEEQSYVEGQRDVSTRSEHNP